MRWIPFETWRWQSQLQIPQLRERLASCTGGAQLWSASKGHQFVGSTSEKGFQLTPVIWGQTSFLPRIIGRWSGSNTGTQLEIDVVPNMAMQISLVILFAFFGILVYDKHLERVTLTTCASGALAWLWLQVAHVVGAGFAQRRLQRLMETTAAPEGVPSIPAASRNIQWTSASWMAMIAVVIVGFSILRLIYAGIMTLTMRPAIDMITVYWTTQILVIAWLFWLSGIRPRTQFQSLMLFFALEVGWTWCMVVDGFAGDGRPMLAWRWSPPRVTNFASSGNSSGYTTNEYVDLSITNPRDFAEFRGRRRDGIVNGPRLNPDWQASPPTIVWQHPVGIGWSSFAIVSDFAITHEQRGPDEVVVCYELTTGRPLWEHRDRALFQELMGGDGPRATPTIHEGKVYTLGATGILNCLDGLNGHPIWTVNVVTENHAPTSLFGMTGSPLIWQDLVIVAPGGLKASLVAYDRQTGRRVWGAGDGAAAYASPQLATLQGQEQIFCFNAEGLFSHAPADGRILWSIPWVTPPEKNNVCQPVVWIDDQGRETVFVASGYGKGCSLFDVELNGAVFVLTPRWHSAKLQAKFASVVEKDGYVYGLDNNILCCIDLRTGERCWKGGRYGFGQLLLVDRHVLVMCEEGDIVLCDATPAEHREVARLQVLNSRTWNHPALSGDRLLIRNDRVAAYVKLPTLTAK